MFTIQSQNKLPTSLLQKKYPDCILFAITKKTLSICFSDNPSHKIFTNFLQELNNKLRIHSHIRSLSLSWNGFCPVPEDLNRFLLLIRSIKHLNHLHIHRVPNYTDDSLPHFLPFLQKAILLSKNLRHFELEITEIHFDLAKLNAISGFISRLHFFAPKLTHFSLTYSTSLGDAAENVIHSNFWPIICKGLRKKIESLTIKLPFTFLLDYSKPGRLDFSPLKKSTSLKELNLNLSNLDCIPLNEKCPQSFVPRDLFPNLRSFKASLTEFSYSATNYLLSLTSKISTNLPKMQNISISLNHMRALNEKEAGSLCSLLSSGINKLNFLSLQFSFLVFTAQITSSFTSLLLSGKLRTVKDLNLNFTRCKSITNFAVKNIGESLTRNLSGLRRLALSFAQFTGKGEKQEGFVAEEISNAGLVYLGNALVNKKGGFERMRITVVGSSKIDDEGVKEFCEKVELIENLKRVVVNFPICQNVTGEAQNYVKEKINKMNQKKQD